MKRTWPDAICEGEIRYGAANNYEGFYLADAFHGIPTIGSVATTEPVTIRGQSVHVFNYPKQTEEIARRLVACWNACVGKSTDEIEQLRAARPESEWHEDFGPALWWCLPVEELPYCGTPLDSGWPGYHTHWTPIILPSNAAKARSV